MAQVRGAILRSGTAADVEPESGTMWRRSPFLRTLSHHPRRDSRGDRESAREASRTKCRCPLIEAPTKLRPHVIQTESRRVIFGFAHPVLNDCSKFPASHFDPESYLLGPDDYQIFLGVKGDEAHKEVDQNVRGEWYRMSGGRQRLSRCQSRSWSLLGVRTAVATRRIDGVGT
jgi:hypothetical protein